MTLKEISQSPQNDFLFKSIFARKENKEMLREFLEAILKVKIDTLSTAQQEATIENIAKDGKECRVDIQTIVNKDFITNMEMQVRNEGNTMPRSVFSAAASLHTSVNAGNDYNSIRKAATICILSYNLFPEKDYIVNGNIKDDFEELTDIIDLYYIQLPKFIETKNKPNDILTQWLYFISQEDKEGLQMAVKENEKVAEAQRQLYALLSDKEVKHKILAWEKAIYSRQTALTYARDQGIAEGETRGIKQGRAEGEKIGETREKLSMAKEMLKDGMPIEKIIKFTRLNKKQINALIKELKPVELADIKK